MRNLVGWQSGKKTRDKGKKNKDGKRKASKQQWKESSFSFTHTGTSVHISAKAVINRLFCATSTPSLCIATPLSVKEERGRLKSSRRGGIMNPLVEARTQWKPEKSKTKGKRRFRIVYTKLSLCCFQFQDSFLDLRGSCASSWHSVHHVYISYTNR